MKIIIVSSSFFTDRMILYTDFIENIARKHDVKICLKSLENPDFELTNQQDSSIFTKFPKQEYPRFFPFHYYRKVNGAVWDRVLRPVSRKSWNQFRGNNFNNKYQVSKFLSNTLGILKMSQLSDKMMNKLTLKHRTSADARKLFIHEKPDLLVTTNIFMPEELGVVSEAKKLSIPVLALVNSWDNLSTKPHLLHRYDGFMLWSEHMREHLYKYYKYSHDLPSYLIGAPQFDMFFDERYSLTKKDFLIQNKLNPDKKFITYAVGSPNLFPGEMDGALEFARRIDNGEFGDIQLIVRLHPQFNYKEGANKFAVFSERIKIQYKQDSQNEQLLRFQNFTEIQEWVNTIKHADVLVNLSSTVAIEGALNDVPVVNINYDPSASGIDTLLIKDVNSVWEHFSPVAKSGGIWLVNNSNELGLAVKEYLKNPLLHQEQRKEIARYICGYDDGNSGQRMAEAIIDFGEKVLQKVASNK